MINCVSGRPLRFYENECALVVQYVEQYCKDKITELLSHTQILLTNKHSVNKHKTQLLLKVPYLYVSSTEDFAFTINKQLQ